MMVDLDEEFAVLNAFADLAQPLEAGAVGGNDAIKMAIAPGWLQKFFRVQKSQLVGKRILVPADHLLALVFQGHGQCEFGADAIAVGPDMAGDADGLAVPNAREDAFDDFRRRPHSGGDVLSISSMILSTRLPRSMESSTTKRNCGVYLSTTERPTSV